MKIFFSVGEPSGDLHGANLINEIRTRRPSTQFTGFGGPRMAKAGCELTADLTELAVMWFFRALLRVPRFLAHLREADQQFQADRPDAVVLIDFPGFNWWVARRAKAHGIPVFYYGVPQLWAWAPWRVHKLRRLTDHVLCKLPFEPAWFRERGCNAHYVGHPYFDELAERKLDDEFIRSLTNNADPIVTLLPGSRKQEVLDNLKMMLDACELIANRIPSSRFMIGSYNVAQAELAKANLMQRGIDAQVLVGRTPELISAATVCIACSGSVSLELLFHEKPSVIVYRVSRIAFAVQRYVRLAKYISLVNLLACENIDRRQPNVRPVPFPEYLTCEDKSQDIAADIGCWLDDKRSIDQVVQQLCELRSKYAHAGASQRAAEYILEALAKTNVGGVGASPPHYSTAHIPRKAALR